jgi:hypothetical protein
MLSTLAVVRKLGRVLENSEGVYAGQALYAALVPALL